MGREIALPQAGMVDEGILDRIGVASPCSMRWDDMAGDERARHCGACRLNVYDISAMTRREAATLIQANEGRLCVRLHRRTDGTVITRNCPVGVRRVRHAIVRLAGSVAAALVLAIGAAAAMGERLRGRSVRVVDTEPYVTLTKLLRTPPAVVPPPPQSQYLEMGVMIETPF